MSSYRSHAAFLARTHNSDLFFAELFGKTGGTASGKSGSMHLTSPRNGFLGASGIVGSFIPVAIGAAFANHRRKIGSPVAVFFGDGALDEGVFWESLNVACLMRIPVLLVCEDNGLAVHTGTKSRRGFSSVTGVVQNFECMVTESDTTDVEEIYTLARDMVGRMEKDPRPVFMNLKCYRYLEHVGIGTDFDEGYRSKDEYEKWHMRDPLHLQRTRLHGLGYSEAELRKEEDVIATRLMKSMERARSGAFPGPDQLYRGVYRETD
jgi:pyruvate dehydrogenase E1 component alpha subunit